MILTILIAFISLIGLMVIHELGHFVLAKKFGTEVEEFGVGYPPRIFGKKIGETIYSLNLIPFGAFVKVKGEMGGIEDYHSFSSKPMWQRFSIVLGGVVSFWVVSFIILSVVAGVWGLPTEVKDTDKSVASPKVYIAAISSDSPAKEADLRLGDIVLGFSKIKEVQEFIDLNRGKELIFTVKRGSEVVEKKMIPRVLPPEGQGPLGVGLARSGLKIYPWYQAPLQGAVATGSLTANIFSGWQLGLKSLLGITELPEGLKMELMGPLGIFDLLRQHFEMGVNYFLFLIAVISIALALANILPIPALDGGKLVFLSIEAIRGKPINHKLEQRISSTFFALLIILMIFVTIKFDIPRVF
ncbi:MAG: site-2 protease family protein [Candidatus Nealsonbacteria bacterium]|nr:site-2 protease family protein [Candidatus Nealsonbacteria bacterium]